MKVECEGDIRKIHLPCSSFLRCVLWEALITWKIRSCAWLSYVLIRVSKWDFCGLCSYIAALLAALGETSEVRMAFPIQPRTCCGLRLLTLTLVSSLHSTGSRTPKQLMSVGCSALCSVFLQSWNRLSHRAYPGLSPDSTVSNISRECFCCTVRNLTAPRLRSCSVSAHSMGLINVPVWHLSCHPVTTTTLALQPLWGALLPVSPCDLPGRKEAGSLARVDYIATSHRPTIKRGQPWPSAHPGSVAKWRQQLELKKQYMRNWKRELDSNLYESEVMKCGKSIRELKDIGGKSMAGRAKDNKEVLYIFKK